MTLAVPVLYPPFHASLELNADALAHCTVAPVIFLEVFVRNDHEHCAKEESKNRIDLGVGCVIRRRYPDVVVSQVGLDEVCQRRREIPLLAFQTCLNEDRVIRWVSLFVKG